MPRQARLDTPGALHHIMVRGINKLAIFGDEADKSRFLERLGSCVVNGGCTVYAWVLMDNHVHVLFRSGKDGISSVMRRLLTWYAQYYNRRHNRSGHLFENRYKSVLCDEENYLLALVRYIHLNPVRANMVHTIEELGHYRWSGHRAVLGKARYPWMAVNEVLDRFGGTGRQSVAGYRRFVAEGMQMEHDPTMSGGGLVRSLGGWSQVIAARRKGNRDASDERILGNGDFVEAVLRETEERQLRQMKHRLSGLTIADIIGEECKKAGIGRVEVTSGARRALVSRTRALIACRSRDELGLSAAEIARHLGVATSAVTRAIGRVEK
ncbi:MAG: transposase [Nitrospirota bacterium]|nr:transposase [Nitrospirota bacterium]